MRDRGLAPVVGVALLVLVSVGLAAVVAGGLAAVDAGDPPPRATLEVAADADTNRISVTHRGGDALDPADVSVYVEVAGTELDRQPPLPFFSARGFVSGPTGPFNPAWSDDWSAGETASLRIAETNEHAGVDAGDSVRVAVRVDGRAIADQTVVAR